MTTRGSALAVAWVHDRFEAAVVLKQKASGPWSSPTPVRSLEDFDAALGAAVEALGFNEGPLALVLEHQEFVHRIESAPTISERAALKYLGSRIDRNESMPGAAVWVPQKVQVDRRNSGYLLHILQHAFFERINQVMVLRRLRLKLLVPLVVPLQQVLDGLPAPSHEPAMVAAEAGRGTIILVARPGGGLVFSRLIMASCADEPVRIAVEVNRSVLYAKQQFGLAVTRAHLFTGAEVAQEVKARCPTLKDVVCSTIAASDWLPGVAALPCNLPLNLVTAYRKPQQRRKSARRFLMAACWLGAILAAANLHSDQDTWRSDELHRSALLASRDSLNAQLDHLRSRNARAVAEQALVSQALEQQLPPVADRFLAYLPSLLPPEARLTGFSVNKEAAGEGWAFHLEGRIKGDEADAGESLSEFEARLRQSPFRVRLKEAARTLTHAPASPAPNGEQSQLFIIEGGLFED